MRCPKCGYTEDEDCNCINMLGRRENKEQHCNIGLFDSMCPYTSVGALRSCGKYIPRIDKILSKD